ncbi:hypothetical protein T265_16253, partial [Opisthorchis viverrini]
RERARKIERNKQSVLFVSSFSRPYNRSDQLVSKLLSSEPNRLHAKCCEMLILTNEGLSDGNGTITGKNKSRNAVGSTVFAPQLSGSQHRSIRLSPGPQYLNSTSVEMEW